MHTLTRPLLVLLALALSLGIQASSADSGAKVATIAGVIDRLDADNSRVVVKTVDPVPSKVKTAVITVDKTSTVTIDKMAATYDDLKAGDQVVVKYSQGVATTVAVTRAPAPAGKTAPAPTKP
jgi:hypothetical protein